MKTLGKTRNSREKTQNSREKLKTQGKNSKLKKKLKFSAFWSGEIEVNIGKKKQGEKNSKLKEKTQNSTLKPKKSALLKKFLTFLCEKLQVL